MNGNSAPDPEAAPGAGAVSGVHYLQDAGEEILLHVERTEPSHCWKAKLTGERFAIAESFEEFETARGCLAEWFHRAFPRHVCNSRCRAKPNFRGARF